MPEQVSRAYTDEIVRRILSDEQKEASPIPPGIEIDTLSPAFTEGKAKLPKQELPPGFFENIANHFVEHEELIAAGRLVSKLSDAGAPDITKESIPEGWNPFEVENIQDLDEKYWAYILESRSPADLEFRRNKVKEQREWDDRLSQGGFFSSLIGGGAGIVASPSTWLFPIAKAPGFAKFGTHLLKPLIQTAPKIIASSALHEALIESSKIGGNVEDFAVNTMRDAAFGIGFYGAGRAISFGGKASEIWAARRVVNVSNAGIDVVAEVDAKGLTKGLVARRVPGAVVSDTELKIAQEYLDNRAVFNGLASGIIGKIGQTPLFGSELIQGLTSPFATVAKFYNRLGNQSVVTGGIERGLPRQITVEELLTDMTRRGRQVGFQLNDLYLEANGFKPGVMGSAKALIKTYKDGSMFSRAQFMNDVYRAEITGVKSQTSKEVNEAAKLIREHKDMMWKTFLQVNGWPENIVPPKTAQNYLMRNYNRAEMLRDPQKWTDTVVAALQKQDAQIRAYQAPINSLKDSIRSLSLDLKIATPEQAPALKKKIRQQKKALTSEVKKLQKMKQDGLVDLSLLNERPWINSEQLETLQKLQKPMTDLNKRIANAIEELPGLTRNEQKASRLRIKQMRNEVKKFYDNLVAQAQRGEIDNALFYTENGQIKFHSIEPDLTFRDTYATVDAMVAQAKGWYDAILGLTPEQLTQNMLTGISGGAITSPIKTRSVLIPDLDLLEAGFLNSDLEKSVNIYTQSLAKKIAIKQVFADMDWNKGAIDMLESLKFERDAKIDAITKNRERTPARDKEVEAINKQFNKAKSQIESAYNYYMGNTQMNAKEVAFTRGTRNWTAITMLGKVPLLQGGELFAMVFKQRLWPTITGGMLPLIRSFNSKAARAEMKANASHARVGLELELGHFSNAMFEGSVTDDIAGTVFGRYLQRTAEASQSIFLTSQITNSLQRLSANITQSRVMSDMFAMAKGTLSKADQKRLLINGINPKDYQLFIDAYKQAGGYSLHGGHVSKWYVWENAAVRNQMRRAIQNDITGSLLTAGLLDKPLWMRNSVLGMPFQFMGYMYAAFNKFTVPLFQSPDASKILGSMMMIAYGAMVEPMRAYQKGNPFEIDTEKEWDKWFVDGLLNSQVLGFPLEYVQTADALVQFPFLDRYRQDKFRRRSVQGLLTGPLGGLASNIVDSVQMFSDGKISQQGLIKFLHTLPIPLNLALDAGLSRAIKSSDLPPTRRDAQYYSWVDRD